MPDMKEELSSAKPDMNAFLQEQSDRCKLNSLPWKDLTIEQKFERMRGILKDPQHGQHWASQRVDHMASHLSALDEHGHLDGKVMIPVIESHRRGEMAGEAREKKVEGWF